MSADDYEVGYVVDTARIRRLFACLPVVPKHKTMMLVIEAHERRDLIPEPDLRFEGLSVPVNCRR